MKTLINAVLAAGSLLLFGARIVQASMMQSNAPIINNPTLAVSTTVAVDVSKWDAIGMQVIYSSANISAFSFTDGKPDSATITVSSVSGLTAAAASSTLCILSTTGISGATVQFNDTSSNSSFTKTEGKDWFAVGCTTSAAATSLGAAINHYASLSVGVSGSTVTVSAISSGTAANSWTWTVSVSNTIISSVTFAGGVNALAVTIGPKTLVNGTDFTSVATASGTAKAISDAIMADSTLSKVMKSTWTSGGVVYTTGTLSGTALESYTNTENIATTTVYATQFSGGLASPISLTAGTITLAAHGISTGYPMYFTIISGTSSLTSGTTYYAIAKDANTIQLATTSAYALAGTYAAISSQTVSGVSSYTLTPTTFAGTWSYKWQASNDGTNYTDLNTTTFPNLTYTVPGSGIWTSNTSSFAWKYLRFNFTAGTGGGMSLKVIPCARSFQ